MSETSFYFLLHMTPLTSKTKSAKEGSSSLKFTMQGHGAGQSHPARFTR